MLENRTRLHVSREPKAPPLRLLFSYCRLLPPRKIAKSFSANGMVGRGGGDRTRPPNYKVPWIDGVAAARQIQLLILLTDPTARHERPNPGVGPSNDRKRGSCGRIAYRSAATEPRYHLLGSLGSGIRAELDHCSYQRRTTTSCTAY